MSDVADLFKKKKKGKKKKKDKKKDKLVLDADAGAAAVSGSSGSASGWETQPVKFKSILGSRAPKLKKTLAPEITEEDVKYEGMTEQEYKQHVAANNTRKELHKARLLREMKAKKDAEAKASGTAAAAAPVAKKLTWREREQQRTKASAGNIRTQLTSASHFPSLAGGAAGTGDNQWTSGGAAGGPAPAAPAAPAGAWGSVAVDDEIKREVEQVLHDQDPEVIKQRALEAERLRVIAEEKRNTWTPSAEEGGIDTQIDNATVAKKVKSMLNEYLNINDLNEAFLCIKELRNPGKHQYVCEKIFDEAFETLGGDEAIQKLANLIVAMRKKKPFLLTKEQLKATVDTMVEFMDDIKIDVPQAPERFEKIIKILQMKQALPGMEKDFILAVKFDGAKEGYDYKMGAKGMGYYLRKDGKLGGKGGGAAAGGAGGGAAKAGGKGGSAAAGAGSKSDPFGGARPVTTKPKADPFGGAKPVAAAKPRADPFGGARPVKTRADPFGGAKPVKTRTDPFGGAKPVKTRTDPFGGAKPVKTRTDPFGGAKPVEAKPAAAAPAAPAAAAPAAAEPAAPEATEDLQAVYGKKKKKKKKKKTGYTA